MKLNYNNVSYNKINKKPIKTVMKDTVTRLTDLVRAAFSSTLRSTINGTHTGNL
jgi:hypothetical protein